MAESKLTPARPAGHKNPEEILGRLGSAPEGGARGAGRHGGETGATKVEALPGGGGSCGGGRGASSRKGWETQSNSENIV